MHLFLPKTSEGNGKPSRLSLTRVTGKLHHAIGDFDIGKTGLGVKKYDRFLADRRVKDPRSAMSTYAISQTISSVSALSLGTLK